MVKGKDNSLLVEFDFVVDLDLAMFKFMRENYYKSPMVNHDFLRLNNEMVIVYNMLNRSKINPLEYIIPNQDTTQLYNSLLDDEDNYKKLLSYANAYDTFPLMITFLKEASSVSIDILCKNEIEKDFINNLNPIIHTVIEPDKKNIKLSDYTVLYIKYFKNAEDYNNIFGKHIYIPAAKFNMEPDKDMVNLYFVSKYGSKNEIHLIDLYKRVKYRFLNRRVDSNDNIIDVRNGESNNV